MSSEKQDYYDFEFSNEIKDSLSIAPSRRGGRGGSGGGGGESVFSSVSRLKTSDSASAAPSRWRTSDALSIAPGSRLRTARSSMKSAKSPNPRPWTSVGGSEVGSVSTSMSNLVSNRIGSAGGNSKSSQTPSEVAKELERQIDILIEKSVCLRKEGKHEEALDTAKEATKKEQLLRKQRKVNSLTVHSEGELMYSTWFCLASAFEANGMPDEAIKTYTYLAKQRGNPFAGRLRINMGNVYYAQKEYPTAIKMYKMALDQTRKGDKSISHKIRRNIGNAFFRLGEIREAAKNFEEAMDHDPDFHTGFNLIVCHLALGDTENVKNYFQALVDMPLNRDDVALEEEILMGEANTSQNLEQEQDARSKEANHFLLTAARLIAPMLDKDDWTAGYEWVRNTLGDRHEEIATEMKLEQATQQLKRKDFGTATKMFKSLQKKGKRVKAVTATNLSFVRFLEGKYDQAAEYADVALSSDRYNAQALVNKGNCFFVNGDIDPAKDLYLEAIGVQADCVQAIFNLGLANAQLGLAEEAIQAFEKVHRITPNNPQILHQIADIYELQGRTDDALKWFNVLAVRAPGDARNLARIGEICAESKDEAQGLHYQLESFRQYPMDLVSVPPYSFSTNVFHSLIYVPFSKDVISWIGSWYSKQENYEK